MPASAPDRTTLGIFAAVVVVGGLNAVAVRYSNQELAPFWGAALRFVAAAALLFAVVLARRIRLPRGRALVGVLLYGALGFAVSYALAYWGLVEAPAGAAAVTIALVPLITLILAPLHGLERFRAQALAGAVVSVVGIGVIFADQLNANVNALSLLALLLAAVTISESTIVVKWFPHSDPAATNAIGMVVGVVILLGLSVAFGEPQVLPRQADTLAALAYLIVIGSVLLFMGYLYVLTRWTASAVTYGLLLMPLVAVPAAAALRGEPVTAAFLAGGALVLAGVYLGAIAPPLSLRGRRALATPLAPAAQPAIAGGGPTTFVPPNCP